MNSTLSLMSSGWSVAPDALWQPPAPLISKDTREVLEVVCFAGVVSVVCLIGIPANLISCLVFWRQGLQDRINVCLFSLSLVDCGYLTCIFTVHTVSSLIWVFNRNLSEEYSSKAFVYGEGVLYGLRSTSGCINMVIAIERCVCVRFPLRVSSVMRTRTMGVLMVLSVLLFQACYLIIPFSYRPVKINIAGNDKWLFVPTTLFVDNMSVIYTIIYTVLGAGVSGVTMVTICVTTGVTIMTLKLALAWRGKTSSMSSEQDSQQRALTTMLVMTSCVYVITMAPFVVRQCSFWLVTGCLTSGVCSDLFTAVTAVVYTISLISSCVHIFIYYRRSAKFRSVLLSLFSYSRRTPSTPTVYSAMSTPTVYSGMSTPTVYSAMSTPTFDSGMSTPTFDSGMSTPTFDSGMSTPTVYSDMSTPTVYSDMSTPTVSPVTSTNEVFQLYAH